MWGWVEDEEEEAGKFQQDSLAPVFYWKTPLLPHKANPEPPARAFSCTIYHPAKPVCRPKPAAGLPARWWMDKPITPHGSVLVCKDVMIPISAC